MVHLNDEPPKINESFGEVVLEHALEETLQCICERGQQLFKDGRLEFFYISNQHRAIAFYSIEKISSHKWLSLIPYKRRDVLFKIPTDFTWSQFKRIECTVFSRLIVNIVKEELKKYSQKFGITDIAIENNYAN